jgi:hypothetical protein
MSGSFISASEVRMQEIIEYVSSRHADSLNREGDVELLMLKKVSELHILHLLRPSLLVIVSRSVSVSLFLCLTVSFKFNSLLIFIV